MNKKLVAVLVCLGFAVSAKAEVNFDQGVDVKSAVKDAAAIDIKAPYPGYPYPGYPYPGYPYPGHYYPNQPYPGYWGPSPHHISYSRDCRTFNFGANDSSVVSERVYLDSTEWVEECYYVPDPPPPQQPNQPKAIDETTKGMQCHQRPGQVFRRTAQLNIGARKLLPWETESFEVCLQGPYMDLDIERQAYNYSVHSIGDYDVQYQLTPQNKVAMAPDKDGLSDGGLSNADGRFTFKVNDRWAAEYAGEKTTVKVELYKDGFWFFNSYKGSKEFTFDAALGYELNFAENELDTSKSFEPGDDPSKSFEPGEATRGAKKYYLKWSFRRVGQLSTGGYVKKGSTGKIEVK
ncbi:MAG: hypothetical protein HY796_03955 [Elusimicrobia bacterium]|nr:hypothetical protein [Elusimicrobiota bacterium]